MNQLRKPRTTNTNILVNHLQEIVIKGPLPSREPQYYYGSYLYNASVYGDNNVRVYIWFKSLSITPKG